MSRPFQSYRVLILAAIPHGLRLDKEIREIRDSIARASKGKFEVETRSAIRTKDIRRAIAESMPNVVHFCGHGNNDGMLLVEDDAGENKYIHPDALASLFKLHATYVSCVLINACHSEKIAEAVSKYINYAIGMNQEVDDASAISFSQGFYDALGYDDSEAEEPFHRAFEEGMVAVGMEKISASKTPVLKKKDGLRERFRSKQRNNNKTKSLLFYSSSIVSMLTLIIFFSLVVLLVFNRRENDTKKEEVVSSEMLRPFLVHKDSSNGFYIQYPSHWMKDLTAEDPISGAVARFKSGEVSDHSKTFEQLDVTVETISKSITLDEYTTQSIDTIINSLYEAFIVDSRQIVVNNIDAHFVIYTGVQDGYEFRKASAWLIVPGKAYVITISSRTENYEVFEEVAMQIVQSFRVL